MIEYIVLGIAFYFGILCFTTDHLDDVSGKALAYAYGCVGRFGVSFLLCLTRYGQSQKSEGDKQLFCFHGRNISGRGNNARGVFVGSLFRYCENAGLDALGRALFMAKLPGCGQSKAYARPTVR